MDIKKLQTLVVRALEDVKAQDIKIYDTTKLTSLFDRLCVVSGTSNRHTKALASSVREKVKEQDGEVVGIEGEDTGEWVLVDLGDMVIHIMQPAIRSYYRLEELWGDKEVSIRAKKRVSQRTAQSTEDNEPVKPARRKTAAKTAPDEEVKPKRVSRAKTSVKANATDEIKPNATKRTTRTAVKRKTTD